MMRRLRAIFSGQRGLSIAEVVVGLAVLVILLFFVGDAISQTLHVQLIDSARWTADRSGEELATRMSEEARSSTAVFIPHTDELGNANDPPAVHEVDFFRKDAAGGPAYVAYRLDAAGNVTRDEYTLSGGQTRILYSDLMATSITAFSAARNNAGAADDVVGAVQTITPVSIYYGRPELAGGNDVVSVDFRVQPRGAPRPQSYRVILSPKAAPTNFAVLLPAAATPAPAASPGDRIIDFALLVATPNLIGGPGGAGLVPSQPELLAGQATISGGDAFSWLDFYKSHPLVADGVYTLAGASGQTQSVSIACERSACPEFAPLPAGTAADGRVLFKAVQ